MWGEGQMHEVAEAKEGTGVARSQPRSWEEVGEELREAAANEEEVGGTWREMREEETGRAQEYRWRREVVSSSLQRYPQTSPGKG